MNAYQRYHSRLAGGPVDKVPNFNIMMTFAAKHIGAKLSDYYQDHRVLVAANLAMVEDFGLDIVQAISDPFRETADFGAEIEFPDDGLPLCRTPLLAGSDDLSQLKPPKPGQGKRMSNRLRAIEEMRRQVGGEIPIMGWVEGALAEAVDLRGLSQFMLDLSESPQWVEELLNICAGVSEEFALAQLEAGADIIGLGDAAASMISVDMYRRYALPREKRVMDAVTKAGGVGRLHICGNTTHLLEGMAASGAKIIDLDWMVDLGPAARTIGDRAALCGNFDPVAVMLRGTAGEVTEAVGNCLKLGGPRLFSAAGCEIPMGTPLDNLKAHQDALLGGVRT